MTLRVPPFVDRQLPNTTDFITHNLLAFVLQVDKSPLITMGYIFHRSCFSASDDDYTNAINGTCAKKKELTAKRQLMSRRSRQLQDIMHESRLIVLAVTLPLTLFSKDHASENEAHRSYRTWLGDRADPRALSNILRHIGHDLLRPGLKPSSRKSKESTHLSRRVMLLSSDNNPIPGDWKNTWCEHLPHAAKIIHTSKTFLELRRVALLNGMWYGEGSQGRPFEDEIAHYNQIFHQRARLGLANESKCTVAQTKALCRELRVKTASELHFRERDTAYKDIVILRALPEYRVHDFKVYAAMDLGNIMTLTEMFFEKIAGDSTRSLIVASSTTIDEVEMLAPLTIIHEIMHSSSCIDAADHILPDGKTCYGGQKCLELVQLDEENDTMHAIDNCDNWAFCIMLRWLELVYPEFNFRIEHCQDPEDILWVLRRQELRHHCTLFDCMRFKGSGSHGNRACQSITDLPEYDSSQDTWASHTGKRRPRTMERLLKIVLDLTDDRIDQNSAIEDILTAYSDDGFLVSDEHDTNDEQLTLRDGDIERLIIDQREINRLDMLADCQHFRFKSETVDANTLFQRFLPDQGS